MGFHRKSTQPKLRFGVKIKWFHCEFTVRCKHLNCIGFLLLTWKSPCKWWFSLCQQAGKRKMDEILDGKSPKFRLKKGPPFGHLILRWCRLDLWDAIKRNFRVRLWYTKRKSPYFKRNILKIWWNNVPHDVKTRFLLDKNPQNKVIQHLLKLKSK